MNCSETIANLAAALVAAQAEMPSVKRESTNPHFRSKYADLASIASAVRPVLAAHGLAIVQAPGAVVRGALHLTTMLLHSSGEWITEIAEVPLSKQDAQGYGSAVTYARRYAFGMLGVVTDDDDDGNAASAPAAAPKAPIRQPEARQTPLDPHEDAPGGATVVSVGVKQGESAKGPWTRYLVTLSDGRVASTFSERVGKAAQDAQELGLAVDAVTRMGRDGKSLDLVSV